jgi:hypothetical protein
MNSSVSEYSSAGGTSSKKKGGGKKDPNIWVTIYLKKATVSFSYKQLKLLKQHHAGEGKLKCLFFKV